MGVIPPRVGWVNFQISAHKVYNCNCAQIFVHKIVFCAQFWNFIPFGPDMAKHNGTEVYSTRVNNENQSCLGKVLI